MPSSARRESGIAPSRARAAHGSAGARRVSGERRSVAALRAALEMRQVAGEPEELQLERDRERVELRLAGAPGDIVGEVEEAGEGVERALVRLLLLEQLQHRLRARERDPEPVRVVAGRLVRADQVDARDRAELATSLVQRELDVAERLEARAEA